jgi:hypothetical protein
MEDDSTKSSMAYPAKNLPWPKAEEKLCCTNSITLSSFRKHHMLYQQEKTNIEKDPIIKLQDLRDWISIEGNKLHYR